MRIHQLTRREILTIRNSLKQVLDAQDKDETLPAYLIVKDEDEAVNDDDITFQVGREKLLKMVAIR